MHSLLFQREAWFRFEDSSWRGILLAIAMAAHSPATTATASSSRPDLVIEKVAIVDVVAGRISEPQAVVVVDGRIAAIGEAGGLTFPSSAVHVDGSGSYLMPGLVDLHVHLFNNASHRPPNEWALPLFVAQGVTAVREMAAQPADMATMARWRSRAERGDLIAPRIGAAGIPVRGDSPEAARQAVRAIRAAGADFIKVFSEMRAPPWKATMEEARRQGLPVCGHIPRGVALLEAARSGQRSNEHLTQVYEACSEHEDQILATRSRAGEEKTAAERDGEERAMLESFARAACERSAQLLAKTGQTQVPTLVLPYFEAHRSRSDFRDDARWKSLRGDEQERWARILERPTEAADLATRRWKVSRQIVRILHLAGVPILAGTDTPMPLVYPGSSLHKELELLVEAGLTPAEAIRAATLGPAQFLERSGREGTIAVGHRADLLLLRANPLEEIANTQRIEAVVLEGRLLRRPELDALAAGGGMPAAESEQSK